MIQKRRSISPSDVIIFFLSSAELHFQGKSIKGKDDTKPPKLTHKILSKATGFPRNLSIQ